MSNRQYPYLSNEKRLKKPFLCGTCKKQKDKGYELEWQTDWFRGDDEYEKICDDCRVKRDAEKAKADEEYQKKMQPIWEAEAKKEEAFWNGMKQKLENKYQVEYLTQYQWRINGVMDIYPVNRKYHNLKTQQRGDYRDMHSFLASQIGGFTK